LAQGESGVVLLALGWACWPVSPRWRWFRD